MCYLSSKNSNYDCQEHIRENFDIFDFELSEEEMNQLASLDKNERFSTY